MIHFTCDLCGKNMHGDSSERFVVRIEIRPAQNAWSLTEEELEADHLEKISQLLQTAEESGEELDAAPQPVTMRYDLCAPCRDRYLKNPFNVQVAPKFDFSEN